MHADADRFSEPVAVTTLLLVAAGSVVVAAKVPRMIAFAGWAFVLASTALVAYGASRLGVLGEVERLLRFWRRR